MKYPVLAPPKTETQAIYELLEVSYRNGGELLVAGSDGSRIGTEHTVGELMKDFVKRRPLPDDLQEKLRSIGDEKGEKLASDLQEALPVITLTGHSGLTTVFLSNVDGEMIYAQQTCGYDRKDGVFLGISAFDNVKSTECACIAAEAKGMKVIGLAGKDDGRPGASSDVAIVVPGQETLEIQELYLPIYHALCLMLEARLFVLQTLEKDKQ